LKIFSIKFIVYASLEPVVVRLVADKQSYTVRDRLHLTCQITGLALDNKDSNVQWFHNNRPLTANERYTHPAVNELVIGDVMLEDSGDFRCSGTKMGREVAADQMSIHIQS